MPVKSEDVGLLYTLNEAAAMLECKRATVYNLIKRHNLTRYYRDGDRRTYLTFTDLLKLASFKPRRDRRVLVR